MELLTKNFKLIGGVLIIICCLLPFVSVLGFSVNGFSFFRGEFLGLLSILLILAGAAALIYVDVTKKDLTLAPKFTLSFVAKLAALAGGAIILIKLLTSPFGGVGFGLILEIIVALALLFEDKIVGAVKK